jgi:hypothetical protein
MSKSVLKKSVIRNYLVKSLKEDLAKSEEMWNNGTSHATIIGYLRGCIKYTIVELE